MAIEIVDFPIDSMVMFYSSVKLPEGTTWFFNMMFGVEHDRKCIPGAGFCFCKHTMFKQNDKDKSEG